VAFFATIYNISEERNEMIFRNKAEHVQRMVQKISDGVEIILSIMEEVADNN
jgi:hypothetical protein